MTLKMSRWLKPSHHGTVLALHLGVVLTKPLAKVGICANASWVCLLVDGTPVVVVPDPADC
jgi:hypothetical protein